MARLAVLLVVVCYITGSLASECTTAYHGQCVSMFGSSCHTNYYSLSHCSFLEQCCFNSLPSSSHVTSPPSHTGGSGSHTPTNSAHCGVTDYGSTHSSTKIVGGHVAQHGEFPWQVSLRYNGYHMCGGTLIDNQWIVSAAHCFEDTQHSGWTVAIGIHDMHHLYTTDVHRVSRVIVHRQYASRTNHNDIAMLKLLSPVSTSHYIKPACLPSSGEGFDNNVCKVSGWGATRYDAQGHAPGTQYLESVDIPVISNSQCKYYLGNVIYDSNICAGFENGGKDACQGDSGGPLVCRHRGGWKLAGIVSWGYGCGDRRTPGVYTRVSSFINWIEDNRSRY